MFIVSDSAKKKLKRKRLLKFWKLSPVIMLITYKTRESSKPTIKPHIISGKKLEQHYVKSIVEIDGLRIIPHVHVVLNMPNANEWLLDVASNGSFVLAADGKIIEPYWPVPKP